MRNTSMDGQAAAPSPLERLTARRTALSPQVQEYAKQLALTIDYRVRLRELRCTLGLTQTKAAEIAGVDQADISKIERGELNPSIERMNRILERLGEFAAAQDQATVG